MTIRALVIDDSVVVRRTVATVLGGADDVEVIGTASDGRLGLRRIEELNPDVVTLDVEMPGMSGIETLAEIRKNWPTLPVIMYSTLTERGAVATLDALALGAVDYATKPSGAPSREEAAQQVRDNLLPLVQMWGRRKAPERPGRPSTPSAPSAASARPATAPEPAVDLRSTRPREITPPTTPLTGAIDMVTIGVSTGGPDALAALLPTLPGSFPVPITIVQHMPAVFTSMLAQRLNKLTPLTVTEAVDGEYAIPGHIYLAPGGIHLKVHKSAGGLMLALSDDPPEQFCRPAVDVLFRTAAAATRGRLLAVVLTGMGHDGLEGCYEVRKEGGDVIVQDEPTSVVWGMPGYVARAGLAAAELPLAEIGMSITQRTLTARARGERAAS
jgi:two-component system chemotaxis response regulator CheB